MTELRALLWGRFRCPLIEYRGASGNWNPDCRCGAGLGVSEGRNQTRSGTRREAPGSTVQECAGWGAGREADWTGEMRGSVSLPQGRACEEAGALEGDWGHDLRGRQAPLGQTQWGWAGEGSQERQRCRGILNVGVLFFKCHPPFPPVGKTTSEEGPCPVGRSQDITRRGSWHREEQGGTAERAPRCAGRQGLECPCSPPISPLTTPSYILVPVVCLLLQVGWLML